MSDDQASRLSHRRVVILGATGSIGRQALEVVAALPQVSVVGLTAGRSVDALLAAADATGVSEICLHDRAAAADAAGRTSCRVHSGDAGVAQLIAAAADAAARAGDELVVLNGIVGAAGLRASLAALEAGATLALANKESMVAGGPFVLAAARAAGARIIPVDSEHSAIFQCLEGGRRGAGRMGVEGRAGLADTPAGIACAAAPAGAAPAGAPASPAAGSDDDPLLATEEILLTGSGGPFRGQTRERLAAVTPAAALRHPNWVMGPKVTIDSATLMNKGLEVIEAHELFGVPYDAVRVVVHPQSIVHSLVRFSDGAVLAHLGVPDMRTPIGYALSWPGRAPLPMVAALDLFARELTFEAPDTSTFRCLALARAAGEAAARAWAGRRPGDGGGAGAAAPIALNAANEVAVQAFLDSRIGFPVIAEVVELVLERCGDGGIASLDEVFDCDAAARRAADEVVAASAS